MTAEGIHLAEEFRLQAELAGAKQQKEVAVEAALYTRPNTLARRVTRRVVCAGESS